MQRYIVYFVIGLLVFMSSTAPVGAQGNSVATCKDSIDSSLDSYIYDVPLEDAEDIDPDDIGYLRRQDILFSTDVSTSDLIPEAMRNLRNVHAELELNCSLLRNTPGSATRSIPYDFAIVRRMPGCADVDFSAREALDLALYCDRKKSVHMDLLKDHIKSLVLRDAQQKTISQLVKKYQEINKKLRGLSDDYVRFTQYISKLNTAIGGIITNDCSE